jgi:hypothetical protein
LYVWAVIEQAGFALVNCAVGLFDMILAMCVVQVHTGMDSRGHAPLVAVCLPCSIRQRNLVHNSTKTAWLGSAVTQHE